VRPAPTTAACPALGREQLQLPMLHEVPTRADVEAQLAEARRAADEAQRHYERLRRAAFLARYQAGESIHAMARTEGAHRRTLRLLLRETAAAVEVDLRTAGTGDAARPRTDQQLRLSLFPLVVARLGRRW
jgi:hypothetical protein